MKDKQFILSEIRRTADLNGGKPVGQTRFRTETSIAPHEWLGVYWARWGDALTEAGFSPIEWVQPSDEEQMLIEIARLVRKYGQYPARAEILLEKRTNSAIPAPDVLLRRLGTKAEIVEKVRRYCDEQEEYADVSAILATAARLEASSDGIPNGQAASKSQQVSGYVYLVKSGSRYKIGCSENHWRRKSELHKQTPEGITEIHTISAIDDPVGIERYWHERFKDKRLHGEWFDLSPEDISAFKKRKFM